MMQHSEFDIVTDIAAGLRNEYAHVAWQTQEVEKMSSLTGETPETICNFIVQHPGTFHDAMAVIMAGVNLAPYRETEYHHYHRVKRMMQSALATTTTEEVEPGVYEHTIRLDSE
jgi:hypothetical protein